MFGKAQTHPTVLKFLHLLETDSRLRKIPLAVIARRLGISTSHLQHLVRRDLGATCMQLIRAKGVDRLSKMLIEHPELTIAEIADQNGYELQTMHRDFTAVLGVNPSEMRKLNADIIRRNSKVFRRICD